MGSSKTSKKVTKKKASKKVLTRDELRTQAARKLAGMK
jgi:hypothetical protein